MWTLEGRNLQAQTRSCTSAPHPTRARLAKNHKVRKITLMLSVLFGSPPGQHFATW